MIGNKQNPFSGFISKIIGKIASVFYIPNRGFRNDDNNR